MILSSSTDIPPQLERALLTALAEGPEKLVEQVGYALEISQHVEPEPSPAEAAPVRQYTAEENRIRSLTDIAEQLNETQLQALYEKVKAVDDVEVRLMAFARLALLLPPADFQAILHDIWTQADQLGTPAAMARVMFHLAPLLMLVYDEPASSPVLREIVAMAQAIGNVEARIRSLLVLTPHLPVSMRQRVLHRVLDEIDRLQSDNHRATAICTLAEQITPDQKTRVLHCARSIKNPAEQARAMAALAHHLPLQPELRQNALNTIKSISDEEERANALIGFAPHLDSVAGTDQLPVLVEQALHIAMGIKRRHVRVRVLVALAPHLTLDLQGEALAAVHSLSSERERTMMLAELAPHLPPNMLVASLAVAHTIEAEDSRTYALSVLARYVPENARERTMLDALNAAASLPHYYERVNALVNLLDIVPPSLEGQIFQNALDTTAMIDNESAKARALSIISSKLPAQYLSQALELGYQLNDPDHRLTALASMIHLLESDEQTQIAHDLLTTIEALPFDYKRARAITEIARFIPGHYIYNMLDIAHDLDDPVDRITAYIALIPTLPEDIRQEIIGQSWQLIREIDSGYDAASALAALAPLLSAGTVQEVAQTASTIIGSIMDEYDQASAIALLAPLVAPASMMNEERPPADKHDALERGILAVFEVTNPARRLELLAQGVKLWAEISELEQSYWLWQTVTQQLAHLPLSESIVCFSKFTPVIKQLGGPTTITKIAKLLEHHAAFSVADSDQ